MSFLKKHLGYLLLLALVYGIYFLTQATAHSSPQVLGVSTNTTLFEEPDSGRAPILAALQGAQKEILVEVYLLTDKSVIGALEGAAARGVAVKVMLEPHPLGSTKYNEATAQQLQQAHIAFSWTDPAFALTHEKAIVIDDSEVFILSQNLTTSAFEKNREYDVLDTNTTDVNAVRNMFIADWERQSFTPTDSHLLVSPNTSRGMLTELIQSATQSISIEMEDINDSSIVQLLSQKAKTLPVELIVPTASQESGNRASVDALASSGVSVKALSSPYIHAKLLLIDGKVAYVGSINFSTQSMDENRELGIVLTDPNEIQKLQTTFTTDWGSAVVY